MSVSLLDWLGIVAGTLTTISFLPQVLRIVRTRSAQDISWAMFGVFAAGTTLWIVWGSLQRALPVIVANSVTLALTFVILALKWRYARPRAAARRVRQEPILATFEPDPLNRGITSTSASKVPT
jgi:MtN3 and saliva related transmembrane protein